VILNFSRTPQFENSWKYSSVLGWLHAERYDEVSRQAFVTSVENAPRNMGDRELLVVAVVVSL
jgi:hypothetical protein